MANGKTQKRKWHYNWENCNCIIKEQFEDDDI